MGVLLVLLLALYSWQSAALLGLTVVITQGLAWLMLRRVSAQAQLTPTSAGGSGLVGDDIGGEALRDGEVEALRAVVGAAQHEAADLRSQLRRAERLLHAAPDGVVVVDPAGHVALANEAARALLSVRREPVGRVPIEVFPVAEVQEAVDVALTGRPSPVLHAVRGDLYLSVEAHPVDDGVMVVVRDVTATVEAERARTEFVANVSHELRTPIAAIMGFAETLDADRANLPADAVLMVDAILRNSKRLSRLFDDLLKLHRIETRRSDLPRIRLLIRPVLEEAVSAAAHKASRGQLTVMIDCAPDIEAWSNREALVSIVSNLVSNACKYTPPGGRVSVRGSRGDDEHSVVVEVEDTGVGIPRQHHERIFERFYRVDEGRARQVGGAGIGLAIVKHFAQAVGAEVTLISEEAKGSRFRVRLPAHGGVQLPTTWDATL